jgi:hypothetical protein
MSSEIYVVPEANQSTSFINRVRSITRKCSFCNCEGHIITSCNNEGLIMFMEYLTHLKNETLAMNNGNRILSIQTVERYLYNFCSQHDSNTKLIKSLACRFCHARLRSSLQVTINKIIMYLFDIDYMTLCLHEYNYIPFNEETPIRVSSIIDGILLNYMANNENNRNNDIDLDDLNKNMVVYNIVLDVLYDTSNTDNTLEPEMECAICYNSTKKNLFAKLECHHEFCIECTEKLIKKTHEDCPYCRSKINKIICYDKECFNKLKNCTET